MEKLHPESSTTIANQDDVNLDAYVGEKQGTVRDVEDMKRLGKTQVFRRGFNFFSILGFTLILMGTWETILATVAFGLGNGGTAGLIYTFIAVAFLFFLIVLSMAEMASMAPTTGGQYHWVSEFAPRRIQKETSYLIGWLSVLGWQVGNTIGAFASGTQIQGLMVLNNPDYEYKRYHGTLIAMSITVGVALFNIFLARYLPMVENVILVLHIAGFVAILVPLWVMAPKTPSVEVWSTFSNAGGWGNTGLACLVGMVTPVGSVLGVDAAVHMAEELKNASKILPRSMIWSAIINGALGFVMIVTFCYTVGDLDSVLSTPTGYPIIQVFYNTTGSASGANGLMSVLIILSVANNLTNMAGASRQLYAFARDGGMVFPGLLRKVPAGWDIPINAVIASALFACVLHCINIGSATAFNQIISLGSVALMSSYFVCIGCMAIRRARGQSLLASEFSLGKFGLVINVLAMLFAGVSFVMCFFPPVNHPTVSTMNWACAVYGGVLVLALVYYLGWARKHYVGPVQYVRKSA